MALYAFDGTWNLRDGKASIETAQSSQYGLDAAFRRETVETNVHRFREFYGAGNAEYLQGVGTRFGLLGRLLGGAFGVGARYRLRNMYYALCRRYEAGDRDIDVVGFSRGGALAVHFTHLIERYGVRDLTGPRDRSFWYYEGLGWTYRFPKVSRSLEAPSVRFLGLWDMVASFGVPVRPLRNRSKRWWITTIPRLVQRSFHAMALDEVRATFSLVRPEPARSTGQHYEVWFRGVHSNIGGGYLDRGLSDISLAWMMEMYLWTLDKVGPATLTPPRDFVSALRMIAPEAAHEVLWNGPGVETLEPDVDGELGRPAEKRHIAWREVPPNALIHHSVFRRTKNLMLDHYRANHRLLRRIPGDARPVYDPPFFYSETPRQAATRVAQEAFKHIPVRGAEWFRVRGTCVARSDHWLAPGERRQEMTETYSISTFMTVATAWLLAGKPPPADLQIAECLTDANNEAIDTKTAAAWIVDVLQCLESYVPDLREFRSDAETVSGLCNGLAGLEGRQSPEAAGRIGPAAV